MFNSAKDNLTRFLKYWKKGNYSKMYNKCQKTWKSHHTQGELKLMFSGIELKDFSIERTIEKDQFRAEFYCKLRTASGQYHTEVVLIKESAAYRPNRNGEWGINPISILKMYGNQ